MEIKTKYDIGDIILEIGSLKEFKILSIFVKKFKNHEDILYVVKDDPFYSIPESNILYKVRNKCDDIKIIDKVIRNKSIDYPRWIPLDEPDIILFEYRNHICIVYRTTILLSLCGYVLLNKHFYKYCENILNINVHGGITYCESLKNSDYLFEAFKNKYELNKIDMETQVIGFDCSHSEDLFYSKYEILNNIKRNATYKTISFVINEISDMVDQIIEIPIEKRNEKI